VSVIEELQKKFAGIVLSGSVKLALDDGTTAIFSPTGEALALSEAADCELQMSVAVLEELIAGRIDPMAAYFAGDLRILGDLSVATELANLLKSGS
jgi:putative sterol carrier protein